MQCGSDILHFLSYDYVLSVHPTENRSGNISLLLLNATIYKTSPGKVRMKLTTKLLYISVMIDVCQIAEASSPSIANKGAGWRRWELLSIFRSFKLSAWNEDSLSRHERIGLDESFWTKIFKRIGSIFVISWKPIFGLIGTWMILWREQIVHLPHKNCT